MLYNLLYETSDAGVGSYHDNLTAKQYAEHRARFHAMAGMVLHLTTKIDRDHWFFSAQDKDGTRYYLHVTRVVK